MGTRDARDERVRRIVEVILALQPGEVVSYGDIADVAGYPKQSRLVGRILSTSEPHPDLPHPDLPHPDLPHPDLPHPDLPHPDLPWWRVVNSSGRLVPGHEREQTALLLQEDVVIRNGHVRTAPHGRFSDG